MTEVSETTPAEKSAQVVKYVRDMIEFQQKTWFRQNAKARENAGLTTGSSWSVLDELAKMYGQQEVVWKLDNVLDKVDDGRITLLEGLTALRDSVLEDLLRARTSNSTSQASNLISTHKMEFQQTMYQLLGGWIVVLEAA